MKIPRPQLKFCPFLVDKVDKVFHRRYHIPVFQVCHIHSMNQILILYLEYVYVSFMDFFYVCHQRNAEGFFHQCGDGVFVRRLADDIGSQTVYAIEASGVFPEAGGQ